jgi:hypothetical protein
MVQIELIKTDQIINNSGYQKCVLEKVGEDPQILILRNELQLGIC